MEVQTIFNPAALDIPELQAALTNWPVHHSYFEVLRTQMAHGGAALVVGTKDDTKIDGVAIITLPQAFTDTMPWVVHFHNEGGRALTHAMVKATLDFIRLAGYTTYKAFNHSGRPDKVWLRIFKKGGKPNFVGSAYIFDLNEAVSNAGNSPDRRRSRHRKPIQRRKLVKSNAKLKANRSNAAVVPATRTRRRRNTR